MRSTVVLLNSSNLCLGGVIIRISYSWRKSVANLLFSLGNSWCSRRIYPVEIYWNRTAALSDCIINLPATHFQARWLDIVEDEWWLVRLLEGPFVVLAQIGPSSLDTTSSESCSYIENSPGEYNSSATDVSMA